MIELTYRQYGEGSPMVILHGLFGSAANWGGHAKAFAAHRRVLVPDLRNHGGSPHADTMDYVAMAGDVEALLDRLGLDAVALLGHSLGGKVAMQFALHHPERVERLIVADIAPRAYSGNQDAVIAALEAVDLSRVDSRKAADRQLAAHIAAEPLRAFLLTNLVRGADGYRWRINLAAIIAGLPGIYAFPDPRGRRYEGPALFISGANSGYVGDADQGPIRTLFPAARFARIAGAGHWLHAERPVEFRQAVQDFLGTA